MTIAFIAGTTAEIIKLSPVMRALRDEGTDYEFWNSAWHVDGLRDTLDDLGLRQPDEHLIDPRHQKPIAQTSQVPAWGLRIAAHVVRHRRRLRRRLLADGRPLVVVHGDTFTTVLGSMIGRFLGVPVAHVEAGLRSGDIRNPMPEEINRRVVARVARLHFAPTQRDVDNLRRERAKGRIVLTGANTAIDTLRRTLGDREPPVPLPDEFGLVTLHRFELLRNQSDFEDTLRLLGTASSDLPLVMPVGEAERARIDELGLDSLFDDHFRLVPKQPYARFLPILSRASFVVTDSGGLQEECAILGIPCAVQREATERHQGIGENVLLTRLDPDLLRGFLADWKSYRRPSQLDEFHPTAVIMDCLREERYLQPTTTA